MNLSIHDLINISSKQIYEWLNKDERSSRSHSVIMIDRNFMSEVAHEITESVKMGFCRME